MSDLNCKLVLQSLWGYEATLRPVRDEEQDPSESVPAHLVDQHLRSCRECEREFGEVQSLRAGLRNLPLRAVPPMLNTKLQVLASRESSRRVKRLNFVSWVREQASRARLFFDNLLRPLAVPAAGGLFASSLCFGVIVDTLHYVPDWGRDIPISFSSEIAFGDLSPFSVGGHGTNVMVQLSVDSQGNVTDFSVPPTDHPSSDELREIGNLVLYSTFTPAVRLGRPIASKRLIRIEHINVKG